MEEELDIILQAVDNASDTFQDVASAAEDMGQSMQDGAEAGTQGFEEVEESAEGAKDPMEQIQDILGGFLGAEVFSQLADALWDVADKAGTFEDSLMRARLEAEGAGIDVNDMTDAVSELSSATGRAGSEIRESFINATARGVTDLDSFKKMMTGAGAQATLFGTDIQSMADKFSNMAMRSTLMERSLASTGITMEELADAMGMTGATADEVKSKWQELDTNQRAAILGTAASMNEGQTANEEYKKSWAGLQAQIDIAKGRIERLVGEILLPVLVPALELAARVLNWLGDSISGLVNGPLGGLISIVGASAAAFALAVPAYMAVEGALTLLTATAIPAATALWATVAPLLPFIALGAALAYVVYEIGKAFGWWTDVSSMMDAIWAGVQRLWSAFINHPDVQGFIKGVSDAWSAMRPFLNTVIDLVLMFFKVDSKSDFDLVRALINAVGKAWRATVAPIKLVIATVQALWKAYNTMYQKLKSALDKAKNAFDSFKEKVKNIINKVKEKIKSLTGIDISGLASKIAQPVADAYERIKKTVEKIKSKIKEIPSNVGSASLGPLGAALGLGFDYEGMMEELNQKRASDVNVEDKLELEHNINLNVDLADVPVGVDTQTLIAVLTDPQVLAALTGSSDFQSLDARAKYRYGLKQSRAKGGA